MIEVKSSVQYVLSTILFKLFQHVWEAYVIIHYHFIVSVPNSESSGLDCVVLCSLARYFSFLRVPFSTLVYKWVILAYLIERGGGGGAG